MVSETSAAWFRKVLEWANHDYCPQLSRYLHWLKHLLTWLVVGAISAGLVGAFVAPQAWFLCGGATLVALVGVIWPKLAVLGLRGTLTFARDRCHEHDSVVATLSVENRWPWPVWGLVIERRFLTGDESARGRGEERELFGLARLPAWSRGDFEFLFTPRRRGEFPSDTPCIVTGFPFGIWSARRELAVTTRLVVWPRIVRLKSTPTADGMGWTSTAALHDRAGDEGDTVSSRPYQQGDSLRKIHWAHTARRDALFVRERQSPPRRHVTVELDSRAFAAANSSAASVSDASDSVAATASDRFDDAVRSMASIVQVLHDQGWDVQCRLDDDLVRLGSSGRGLRLLLDRLACCSPNQPESVRTQADNAERDERVLRDRLLIRVVPSPDDETPNHDSSLHVMRFRRPRHGPRVIDIATPAHTPTNDWARQLVRQWEDVCHDDL